MTARSTSVRLIAAAACIAGVTAALAPANASTAAAKPGFRKPIFLDTQLAGSEGFVIAVPQSHRLIYTSHEGTTLLFRGGLSGAPTGDADFASTYRNQVNMWSSTDDGVTWQRINWTGTGFFTPPNGNLGFSDPDLTVDGAGNLYVTGIDLVNDALVSSPDGGVTWPTGTVQCHEGDRPWLAGGKGKEVFLADNSEEYGHIIVRSVDGGATCSSAFATGVADGYTGYGKPVYDASTDTIYEAAINNSDLGVIALRNATTKFAAGSPGTVEAHLAVANTSFNTFWQAQIAEGIDHTLYMTWTTDDRKPGTSGGCNGAHTPAPNSVMLTSSHNGGRTWSKPVVVAHPGVTVLWPWIIAGTKGRVSVAWYQYDRVTDLNCAPDAAKLGIRLAMLTNANTARPSIVTVDPIGRPVHYGQVCTGGTSCVATGQDRRLGEFFTLAPDLNGCVMIATGDTTMVDPVNGSQLPTARPLFTVQSSGTSLYGRPCRRVVST